MRTLSCLNPVLCSTELVERSAHSISSRRNVQAGSKRRRRHSKTCGEEREIRSACGSAKAKQGARGYLSSGKAISEHTLDGRLADQNKLSDGGAATATLCNSALSDVCVCVQSKKDNHAHATAHKHIQTRRQTITPSKVCRGTQSRLRIHARITHVRLQPKGMKRCSVCSLRT